MIRVNLMPHRAIRREALKRQFIAVAVGVAVFGVAIWFLVHTLLADKIEDQQGRNRFLEEQIVVLDKQIEEIKKLREQTAQLLARKKVVESLQANRAEAVHLLDELVRQLPDGVYLKGVKQTGQRVAINGYAQSNARVSTLMRNLESSPWLEQASLVEIKSATHENQRLSEFQMNVNISRAKADDGKKPAAKVGGLDEGSPQQRPSAALTASPLGG
jgi:type IV pilus assembly protein PilN